MIRVEKRKEPLRYQGAVAASSAVVIAFLVGCVIFAGLGVHPLTAYLAMGKGVFSSVDAFSEVLVKATPLIFTGLAVATAASMMEYRSRGSVGVGGDLCSWNRPFSFSWYGCLACHPPGAGRVGAGRPGLVAHSSTAQGETQG